MNACLIFVFWNDTWPALDFSSNLPVILPLSSCIVAVHLPLGVGVGGWPCSFLREWGREDGSAPSSGCEGGRVAVPLPPGVRTGGWQCPFLRV